MIYKNPVNPFGHSPELATQARFNKPNWEHNLEHLRKNNPNKNMDKIWGKKSLTDKFANHL